MAAETPIPNSDSTRPFAVQPVPAPVQLHSPPAADARAPGFASASTLADERFAGHPGEWPAIPGYEIVEELGRGGMGVVYKARELKLNRTVALKTVSFGTHASAGDLTRLRREATAIARLQHPNIVQVFEVGEITGAPYFSMELCSGGTLSQRVRQGSLPVAEAAAIVAALARAVHASHEQGVIHRDLKPSNILLAADGAPKVADFGLAKFMDAADDHTRSGAILGTPNYMAPEQAGGKTRLIGPGTDVYALGAILFELLTGDLPFRAGTTAETIHWILHDDPRAPSQLRADVPADLDAICLKCLQKRWEDRYTTAAQLADDLDRFANGEPVSARRSSMWTYLGRIYERSEYDVYFATWYPLMFAFAAVFLVTHTTVFILKLYQIHPLYGRTLRTISGLVCLAMFVWFRSGRLLPRNQAERHVWSITIGFVTAAVLVPRFSALLVEATFIPLDPLRYFFWSILSGMAFFALGSSFWGRCYLIGMMFFAAALWIQSQPYAAPLVYGGVWTFALICLGVRLRALKRAMDAPETDEGQAT